MPRETREIPATPRGDRRGGDVLARGLSGVGRPASRLLPVIERVVLAVLVCGLVSGCTRKPTQLVVVVESDYPPGVLTEVEVATMPLGGVARPEGAATFSAPAIPFSLGVVSPGGQQARVEITVTARDASGLVRATQRLRTGFLPGHALRLPVFLAERCERVVCTPDQRCDPSGTCVDGEVDETTLEEVAVGAELPDAGPPVDAVGPDAARPPLSEPTRAEVYAHTVGTDVRGFVRLPDGTIVVTAERFGASPGATIGAYRPEGAAVTERWRVTTAPGAPRPIVVGDGLVLNGTLGDSPLQIVADRTVSASRPSELVAGDIARGIVGLDVDGSIAWEQVLWARPSVAGAESQVWCQLCARGSEVLLACQDTGGGTLMLDDAPITLGAPRGGTATPGDGALIRARVGPNGLEGFTLVRWFEGAHDAYCAFDAFDPEGGYYAAFRHTDVLRGLDRDRDPAGADTMTVARFYADGSLRWAETILAVGRNPPTPSGTYPRCYSNLALTVAPSGFYVATWFPSSSPDCLRSLTNGSGPIASGWANYPMVTATLGPNGEVSADRVHLAELGGVAWSLTTHPSGTVLLAGHVDDTAPSGDVFGVPVTVSGVSDGILLGLDPLGGALWSVVGTSGTAGSSDAFLGVVTEPGGAIWLPSLHTMGTGTILGTTTTARSLARLE